MDNQENETFTGGTSDPRQLQEAFEAAVARKAILYAPPDDDGFDSEGAADALAELEFGGFPVELPAREQDQPLWRELLLRTSNADLAKSLRMHGEQTGVEAAETAEALARLLEALPVKSHTVCAIPASAPGTEAWAKEQGFAFPARAVAHATPALSKYKWLSSLQSMPLADLAAELSEEGALRYRGLLWRAYGAMQAFTDPEGRMPADTGEFNDLKAIMHELEAALGI